VATRVDDLIEEADHLTDDERFDEALAVLDPILETVLTDAQRLQALMSRASVYDARSFPGDHELALADCAAALAIDPRSPDIHYLRSTIHQSVENWGASLADLSAAIAIEPHADFYEARGLSHYNLADYAAARDDFARAIATNPDIEARFHVFRGMAALLLHDPQAALDDFTNALDLDPDDPKALAQRAKAHEACDDPKSALVDLDRLHALLPASPLLDAERARLRALTKPRRPRPSKAKPKPKPKPKSKSKPKPKPKPKSKSKSKSR